MNKAEHKILFEGGPFHGLIRAINCPPPSTTGVNRGYYHHVGRIEVGYLLYRWKGPTKLTVIQ